jgi:hypothetical protein
LDAHYVRGVGRDRHRSRTSALADGLSSSQPNRLRNLGTFRTLPGHAYDVLHSSMAECLWIVDSGVMLTLEVVVVQQAKRLHERSVRFTSCAPARCPDER